MYSPLQPDPYTLLPQLNSTTKTIILPLLMWSSSSSHSSQTTNHYYVTMIHPYFVVILAIEFVGFATFFSKVQEAFEFRWAVYVYTLLYLFQTVSSLVFIFGISIFVFKSTCFRIYFRDIHICFCFHQKIQKQVWRHQVPNLLSGLQVGKCSTELVNSLYMQAFSTLRG